MSASLITRWLNTSDSLPLDRILSHRQRQVLIFSTHSA